jgi:preprotein translocase subunit YajC
MKRKKHTNALERLGTAIGVGLIAGLAGTVAMTISQMIEMKLTDREPSTVPADAVAKTLDVQATDESQKPKVAQEVHWTYGASLGITRGLLAMSGLRCWPATLAHFSTVWGASMIMLPSLELAPPVQEQKPKSILIDGWHHAVYAVVTGLVYDAIAE